MKNNYKAIRLFIALLSLIAIKAGAQALNGAYTINNNLAASPTNFQTFSAFAAALNTNGVSGPVTANVTPGSGPYNEQFAFNQITGASSSSKITINGNGCTIAYTGTNSSLPYIINMNGADYFSINSLNLNMTGTYCYNVVLMGGADNNVFSSCTMSVPVNSTSSYQIPIFMTGSTNSMYTEGNSGNGNTFINNTIWGGYAAVWLYSTYGANAGNHDNKFINNNIMDFYEYAFYVEYTRGTTIQGNDITMSNTRTNSSYPYGIASGDSDDLTIDGNRIHGFFNGIPNTTTGAYGIESVYNANSADFGGPAGAHPNRISNNMIYDFKGNGYYYGMECYYIDGNVYNNTVSFDNAASTGGTTYGFMCYYTETAAPTRWSNNILSISKAGTKYGYYAYTNTVDLFDRNVIYLGTTGTSYIAYLNGTSSYAGMVSAGATNLYTVNPSFANVATNDLHPTNPALNNLATPMGLVFDNSGAVRNPTTPDIGALEFLTPQCANSPSLTSVVSPTYAICPGNTANLGLSYLQSDAGIGFQWQYSTTSPVGPWTSVPSATLPNFTTPPVTGNIYYSALVTCANGNGSLQAISGQLLVAGTTTNNVPYNENFEGVGYNGMLPNCSWMFAGAVSSYTGTQSGYMFGHNSAKFMSFSAAATGTNYAYTNGVLLKAGVTYSANAWYLTEYSGLTNFTDLSLLIGTSQTAGGLSPIISSNGAAIASQYAALGGTFTIPTTGLYYLAIRETNTSGADHLTIDDVSITVPCQVTTNSPSLAVLGLTTACLGSPVSLTANGADSYTWTNSANTTLSNFQSLSNTPGQAGTVLYNVMGTNTLSGCTSTVVKAINVVAGPVVSAYMLDPNNGVCPGETAVLYAVGSANSYTWSTSGLSGANTTVQPTSMTTYTVLGSNATNCTSSSTITVNIKTAPSVTGAASHNAICVGDFVTLTASGADTYSWVSSSSLLIGNSVIAYPTQPTNYQLVGTDATTGCSGTALISVNVAICTGISSISGNTGISVYPNPTNGEFAVESGDISVKTIQVTDVTGRVLISNTNSDAVTNFSINNLAGGVYYVKIQSAGKQNVVKIVKQ